MKTKNILITDDEESFLESLRDGLEDHEFNVLTATNGKQAVNMLQSRPVDLVVTDLKMPEMSGYELVAYMGRNFPRTPVIVMTAYGSPEMEENFRMLGVSYYLEKPLDIEEMAAKIEEALEEKESGSKMLSSSAHEIIRTIYEALKSNIGGEVVVRHENNSGKIFITKGKIAWVTASSLKHTFFTYLIDTSHLGAEELKEVFEECKRSGKNFGETIVEWNLMDRESLRQSLLEYITASMLEILSWPKSELMFVPQERSYKGTLLFDLDEVINTDLGKKKTVELHISDLEDIETSSKEISKSTYDKLAGLKELDGFMAAGAFSHTGACLAELTNGGEGIAEVGRYANEVLLEAQKATDIMGVGRGNMVHISAPQADIMARCYNENTDFTVSEPGKAHVHVVLMISEESNLAWAKMKLEQTIMEIAPDFR
ncbi:MAG: response regulator [bacterium]